MVLNIFFFLIKKEYVCFHQTHSFDKHFCYMQEKGDTPFFFLPLHRNCFQQRLILAEAVVSWVFRTARTRTNRPSPRLFLQRENSRITLGTTNQSTNLHIGFIF